VLVTYRPEYEGALARVAGAQTIALAPLSDSETAALVSELLGSDPSVGALATVIAERAAGNPFFAEEMVRDLAERGVLRGNRRAYVSTVDAAEVTVPATVQATIAARIDRLDPAAKRTLCAAAVIGSRFSHDLLETLGLTLSWRTCWGASSSIRSDSPDNPSMCFIIRSFARWPTNHNSNRIAQSCTGDWPPPSKPASRNRRPERGADRRTSGGRR